MKRTLLCSIVATLGAAALAVAAARAAAPAGQSFTFARLNRTYSDLAPDLAPVQQGPLVVRLQSPSSHLVVAGHEVLLSPVGDGTHRAELLLDVLGGGVVEGDVELAGMVSPLSDRVVMPRQQFRIPARLRLTPSLDGFEVTPIELPSHLRVALQSQLGSQLVGLCDQLTALLLAFDCSGLDRSLSSLRVPLPPPGETYLLPMSEIAPEERSALLRYLEDTSGPA
ncbi:MAG TPA: hypothetical protein VMT16_12625 [Thermoanaerobaculia bacterium]|nr:hypothetical protein [Thermoanaerobaculia bacterium]